MTTELKPFPNDLRLVEGKPIPLLKLYPTGGAVLDDGSVVFSGQFKKVYYSAECPRCDHKETFELPGEVDSSTPNIIFPHCPKCAGETEDDLEAKMDKAKELAAEEAPVASFHDGRRRTAPSTMPAFDPEEAGLGRPSESKTVHIHYTPPLPRREPTITLPDTECLEAQSSTGSGSSGMTRVRGQGAAVRHKALVYYLLAQTLARAAYRALSRAENPAPPQTLAHDLWRRGFTEEQMKDIMYEKIKRRVRAMDGLCQQAKREYPETLEEALGDET